MKSATFCVDELWNPNLTWNTNKPKLTGCLAQVAFTIAPSVVFLILSLVEFKFIFNSKNKKIRLNNYNVIRSFICLFAIYSNLSLAIAYLTSTDTQTLAKLLGSVLKLIVFMVLIVIYHYHRLNGIITSGIIFSVLLLNTICSLVLLFDTLLFNSSMYADFETDNIYRIFLCNICLFVLSCFTDNAIDAGLKPEYKVDEFSSNGNIEKKKTDQHLRNEVPDICPKQYSSFISKISFYWYTSLVKLANRRELKINEIYGLDECMKTEKVIDKFNKEFYKEIENIEISNHNQPQKNKFNSFSLLKVICRYCSSQIMKILFLKTIADLSRFCTPFLIHLTISFVRDENEPQWHGVIFIIGFILSNQFCSISTNFCVLNSFQVAINLRTAISNLVFYKSLRLSPKTAKNKRTTGQITNLFVVDASRFISFAPYFAYIWSGPLQIVIGFYMLYSILGNATFFSIFIMTFVMLSQYSLNRFRSKYSALKMKYNDNRMMLINETLVGIRIIKLSAWEEAMIDRIETERNKQVHYIKLISYLDMMVNWFFFSFSPFLILTSTIAIYVFFIDSSQFTAEKAFVAISIFNILDYPIEQLPTLISYLIQCKVSIKRLSDFFGEDELKNYVSRNFDEKFALSIKNKARFTWEMIEEEKKTDLRTEVKNGKSGKINQPSCDNQKGEFKKFELNNIEMDVAKGSLVAVIGSVGAGKSSLLSAILGEMHLVENDTGVKGEINISDDQVICHVAQQAWIQNCSFKDNILFGRAFDEKIYKEVINACALEPDLQQFEAGDETEIGEKGINLSGGQKQRVSLARACYSSLSMNDNNQIITLDDPLSAVDAHVCKNLCDNVLSSKTGLLKSRTRVLVTNQLNQLGNLDVDQIILMNDGQIKLKCTYDELIEMQLNGQLADYDLKLSQDSNEKITENVEENEAKSQDEKSKKVQKEGKTLIEKERREKGRVDLKNYGIYLKYFGWINAILALIFMIGENFFQIYSKVYLAQWTELHLNTTDAEVILSSKRDHLSVFAGLVVIECVLNIVANVFIIFGILSTVKLFHKNLLYRVLRSPISFFDTNPLGRIVNRFNKDIEAIDEQLPFSVRQLTVFLLRLLATILLLIYKQPNSLIFYLIVFSIYYVTMNLYINSSRSLKRYESTTKSPVYSHLSETLAGVSTIRAYGKSKEFEEELTSKIDINNRCNWYFLIGNRWLKWHLDFISNFILLIVTLQFVLQKKQSTSGDVGLLITYTLNMTSILNFLIRFMGIFETNSVSIERLSEYCNNVMEDDWYKEPKLSIDWPQKGEVEFKNYSTRYREGTNLILKNLNFKVNDKEKIGVVGRTGAGKSTLTLALFRIIEPCEGQIIIDHVDISQIGLHELRKNLSIIPQDPFLFTGSIRFNLDPFDKYTDAEIYQSLEHAHLINYVNTLEDGIYHQVAENGVNFSVGQRQLMCLARALLRKSKILVLDEATASVDFTTDELVQKTIRSEFEDCTTITIAHRISTVIDSSKILVLDQGELLEYDEVDELLKNRCSLFYMMAAKANIV